MTDDITIRARRLHKAYGDFTAVDGIDFEIRRGECFGFLGPNGAGKTTTMRMIYRAVPVGGGELEILGMDAASGHHDRAIKARLGVVPQEDSLDQDLTVRENLEIFCRFYGMSRPEARARASDLLGFANLEAKADAKTMQLSGGMKRRLLIARGLINRPDIVVLDEPTTGLDPRAREVVWERLADLRDQQATILLSTHYMGEAERLCDRLVIMDAGRIVGAGTPAELIATHVTPQVVEVRLQGRPGDHLADHLPGDVGALLSSAERSARLRDRLLLYTRQPDALVAEAARLLEGHTTLVRPASLEDVFLTITGHGLED